MRELAVENLLAWAEDRRELKNLLGKYAQCLLLRRDDEIVDLFWSGREDICLGCNRGYYRGAAAVRGYFAAKKAFVEKATALLMAALPEEFAGKSPAECFGAGWLEIRPVQDPVIEIYEDGTARAAWYSQGNSAEITTAGPMAFWTFGSNTAEFVKEDGAWRILNHSYLEDIRCPVGADWRNPERYPQNVLPEFAVLDQAVIPAPNEVAELHRHYSPERPFARLPVPPAAGKAAGCSYEGLSEADAKRLHRVLAREQVEQLMARRVFYSANLERDRELEELWVQSPEYRETASFGGTWGFHVGMEAIRKFYAEPFAGKEPAPGYAGAQPLSSPAIQVAGDGKTAKGLWYSTGYLNKNGEALWICGKVAADFVLEDGQWRIWHLCEVADGTLPPGTDFGDQIPNPTREQDPLAADFGEPTIAVQTHERLFCWSDDFPWMPEPYESMSPELGYDYAGFSARRWEAAKL